MRKFFRTPKGLLLIVLVGLVAIAAPHEGLAVVVPGLAAAVVLAGLLDAAILRVRDGGWAFPSGAVLTALIVAMVLSSREPWHVTAATAVLAIVSKYVCRYRTANVFNPAALAMVATFYLFDTGHSWWGALPDVAPPFLILLFVAGLFITDRVNKMPMVLAFLGAYYGLFTGMAFAGDPRWVAEIYRTPDVQAVLYFAFFILTDPPTSPTKYRHQVICGVLVAVTSVVFFEALGVVYYLLAGVLVGNVWETWRRWRAHRGRERQHRHPRRAHDAAAGTAVIA
ncbi:MAG: RnfABCDGE type electron transport complex subunit D [Acidobacteria bacterium]|nr:RnfABCDGE type electron transport complex subunit D [Acidobacteriota bacterium]